MYLIPIYGIWYHADWYHADYDDISDYDMEFGNLTLSDIPIGVKLSTYS